MDGFEERQINGPTMDGYARLGVLCYSFFSFFPWKAESES